VKQIVFEIMDGSNKRSRPRRRWTNYIKECCDNDLYTHSKMAADRTELRQIVKYAHE